MLKIIKVIFFISLIFSVFNLYSEDYSTIVQGDDEDVSELLQKALDKYSNRAIEAAQVIEELIQMAKAI